MLIDNAQLKDCMYQVELQLMKLHQLNLHKVLKYVPEQKRQAKTACAHLIEELSKIMNELEKQEKEDSLPIPSTETYQPVKGCD